MLKKIHLFTGILVIIVFLLTGQFMHHQHNHLKDMDMMNRALFRAGHLYILLFGLINVSLGSYFEPYQNKIMKYLQTFGSVVVLTATFLVIYGFFIDLPTQDIERYWTRISLYLILFGVVIHGLLALISTKKING